MDPNMETDDSNAPSIRKSTRKRVPTFQYESSSIPIKKCFKKEQYSELAIEDIYLQKDFKLSKFKTSPLETIFESPQKKGYHKSSVMSVGKYKRECKFSTFFDPPKIKKKQRKDKASKLKRLGVCVPSGRRVSINQVKEALKDIYESCNEHTMTISEFQKENLTDTITSPNMKELSNNLSNLSVNSHIYTEDESSPLMFSASQNIHEIDNFAPLLDIKPSLRKERRRSSQFFIPQLDQGSLFHSPDGKNIGQVDLNNLDKDNEVIKEESNTLCLPEKRKTRTIRGRGSNKRARGRRRDSGICKPLYFQDDLDEDCENIDIKEVKYDPNDDSFIPNVKRLIVGQNRRRSARLNICPVKDSTLGSLWDEN